MSLNFNYKVNFKDFYTKLCLPVHRYNVDIFSYSAMVLREYWVLTESRIPLKPVLGGMRIVAQCPLVLMNRLNKTKSAVVSLFLTDPFFQIIQVATAVAVSAWSW